MVTDCVNNKQNLGVGRCADLPQLIRGIITTPADFKLTEEDIADQTVWQAALADENINSRIFLWPLFATVPENISTETVYEDNPVAYNHVLDGRYRWKCMISKSLCFHKAAFTHRSNSDRVWLIDARNNIIGTYVGVNDDGDAVYSGFSLDLLNVENLLMNDATISTRTPIIVALKDPNEVNDITYGAFMFKLSFINLLKPLTDVNITVVSVAADEIVVDVTIKCDGTAVQGLEAADFSVTEADGDAQLITAVTEGDDGRYTITRASGSYVDGFVNLIADPTAISLYPNAAYDGVEVALDVP